MQTQKQRCRGSFCLRCGRVWGLNGRCICIVSPVLLSVSLVTVVDVESTWKRTIPMFMVYVWFCDSHIFCHKLWNRFWHLLGCAYCCQLRVEKYRYISWKINLMKNVYIFCHSFQKVKPIYYIDSLNIELNISSLYFLKFWWLLLTDNENPKFSVSENHNIT